MGKTRVKKVTIAKPERPLSPPMFIHFLGWGVLLLLFLIGQTVARYWAFRGLPLENSRLEEGIKGIAHYDSLLTAYARSSVTFKDSRAEVRYVEAALQRDRALAQVKEVAPGAFTGSEVSALKWERAELGNLEDQALEYVRAGRQDLADPLVFGGAYDDKLAIYERDRHRFAENLRRVAASDHVQRRRKVLGSAVLGVIAMPLLAVWHLFLIRRIDRFYALYVPAAD
ncbi:MAG: hypothetical protein KTQ49_08680 [Candidatus Omnitrophica bacterium]|nr:hypothetical protein [Candidatus Omnitrophota bacterium]